MGWQRKIEKNEEGGVAKQFSGIYRFSRSGGYAVQNSRAKGHKKGVQVWHRFLEENVVIDQWCSNPESSKNTQAGRADFSLGAVLRPADEPSSDRGCKSGIQSL